MNQEFAPRKARELGSRYVKTSGKKRSRKSRKNVESSFLKSQSG